MGAERMPWHNDKVVGITGATGRIGRELLKRLMRESCSLHLLIHRHLPDFPLNGNVKIFKGVLPDRIPRRFLEGCTVLIHLAGVVPGSRPVSPAEIFRVNDEGTRRLYELACKHGVKRFIFTSTIRSLSIQKKTRDSKATPYLLSKKLVSETLCRNPYTNTTVSILYLPTVLIRRERSSSTLSGWMTRAVLKHYAPGPIRSRTFYITDSATVVDTLVRMIREPELNGPWILKGISVSFRELINTLQTLTGQHIRYIPIPFEIAHSVFHFLAPLWPKEKPSYFWTFYEKCSFLAHDWTVSSSSNYPYLQMSHEALSPMIRNWLRDWNAS